jgi:signal transduction histidine kinase
MVIPNLEGGLFSIAGEKALGRVRVGMSLEAQRQLFLSTLRYVLGIAGLILAGSLLLGYFQFRRLLAPMRELARAARRVGRGEYDGLGAVRHTNDEVGVLVESFDQMVRQVAQRTGELADQVNAKERARAELAETQQRLIDLSRKAGMAEIASSVLHNVGNVLNSVNVSITLVSNRIRESRIDKLAAAFDLLQTNSGALDSYLAHDPKGQRVMPYLGKLTWHFQQEREATLEELGLLTTHIGHIKQIVSTQQNYARVSGLVEQFSLVELAEDALRIMQPGCQSRNVTVIREFEETPRITSDKHQVLQILLNLLRNANRAIQDCGKPERVVRIRIRRQAGGRVRLEVKDSGVGLSREHLTRVFAHGFTTKSDGHGFGLHSGALAARNLGGALWAESDGPGTGAAFTLELPIERVRQEVA